MDFPGGSESKESPCNVGDLGSIPELEDSLEKEMATHSYILAWRIPRTEEPGWLRSMGSERIGHNWVANTAKSMGKWEMCSMTIFLLLIWKEMICSSCPPDPSGTFLFIFKLLSESSSFKEHTSQTSHGKRKKMQLMFPKFSSGHVWMWELDYKESWAQKNWCFWTVVLEKTFESPLDCKEIQPVHPKGDQSWVFIGRTDVEAETLILWPPDVKN